MVTDEEAVVLGSGTITVGPMPWSVFERVHAVLSDLPAIGKNSQAPGAMGGYKFRGIEDITAALKPLLAKHGVFMVPTVKERHESVRQTGSGKALYVVDLLVRFTFYATDNDPSEKFDAEVWGQGSDSGDKAVQKAMTSAFKTMLSITFCISDSEYDAERHDVEDSGPVEMGTASTAESPGPETHATVPSSVAAADVGVSPPEPSTSAAPSYFDPGKNALDKATARCSALAAIGVDILKERRARKLPELRKLRDEVQWHEFQRMLDVLEKYADDEAAQVGAAT